jgi:hypothetical protein
LKALKAAHQLVGVDPVAGSRERAPPRSLEILLGKFAKRVGNGRGLVSYF